MAEVAIDPVALVLLQQLVGDLRIAGLRAGVDGVEGLGLLIQVEAQPLEVFEPVRVFDDHPDLGIGLARRSQHQVPRRRPHGVQPVLGPAARALGGDVGVALGVEEEEVVQDHFVEVPGREPDRPFAFGPVGRVLVVEDGELAVLVARREGDATGDGDSPGREGGLHRLDLGVRGEAAVAVDLDIDLVEGGLAHHPVELALKRRRVREGAGGVDNDIDRHAEVLMRLSGAGDAGRR